MKTSVHQINKVLPSSAHLNQVRLAQHVFHHTDNGSVHSKVGLKSGIQSTYKECMCYYTPLQPYPHFRLIVLKWKITVA